MARKPSLTTDTIRREIQADTQARKAKAAAKRTAKKADADAAKQALIHKTEQTPEQIAARKAKEAAAALTTMAADYEALLEINAYHEDGTQTQGFTDFLVAQGFKTDGTVAQLEDAPPAKPVREATYTGPMLALRDAAKRYTTGKNGNPHCADPVAMALDGLTREQVVKYLGAFLFMHGVTTHTNPYAALNPGQQSMNLRNKLRGALKAGTVTMEKLKLQIEAQAAESK